jgi:hypothetical protein
MKDLLFGKDYRSVTSYSGGKIFTGCTLLAHNQFLPRNQRMASPHWWRGLRLQPVSAAYWVGQMGAGGYADSDKGMYPRHPSSHWLQVIEIPSVESWVMSLNMAQAA